MIGQDLGVGTMEEEIKLHSTGTGTLLLLKE
jgi:hypothetical protein